MSGYPKHTRKDAFSINFIKRLVELRIAEELGQSVFALLVIIVSREDERHYKPVNFYNRNLTQLIGVSKEETMVSARHKAVEAGWLYYRGPRRGSRLPGIYWVTVPPGLDIHTPIGQVDEQVDEYAAGYHAGYLDGKDGKPAEPYPAEDDNTPEAAPINGVHSQSSPPANGGQFQEVAPVNGGRSGGRSGGRVGGLLNLDLNLSSPDTPKPKKRQPVFEPEDRATAEFIHELILELLPNFKKPDLDKWASTVRLMRERDGRTQEQIRDLFALANRHDFWRSNILSPDKLREKFDQLQAKLGQTEAPAPYKEISRRRGMFDGK